MNKSALKYLTRTGIAPEGRMIRQDSFATDRTQQRKRTPYTRVRPAGRKPEKG